MRVALSGFTEDIGQFWNSLKWQSDCLDPNRPGWLPKWIPTPEEKACQFGLYQQETPPNPPAPQIAAPQTVPQMTQPEHWTPLISAQQTRVNYIDGVTNTIDTYLKQITEKQKKDNEMSGTTSVAVAALLGVAIFLIARR